MHITRIALLPDGICVWFGKEERHYETNYYSDGITSLGKSDTHDHTTVWGSIDHLRSKSWWNDEIEHQMVKECCDLIGLNGSLIL